MRFLTGFCFLFLIGFSVYGQAGKPKAAAPKQLTAEKAKAGKGNVQSMYNVGCYYYYGTGVQVNFLTASQWLTKAANKNHVDAMLLLADIYDEGGSGVKKDATKCLSWYKKAAAKGSSDAAYELGEKYENGDGVTENMVEAVKWYTIAAEKGDGDAMIALAFCYMDGDGVTADQTEGRRWFLKAAEAGLPEAMRYLGDFFAQADMGNDCKNAITWYMKAADAGDSVSVKPVGVMLMKDECPGTDKATIASWMKRKADDGNAEACFYMGGFYITGMGVPRNSGRGMEYLIKNHELSGISGAARNYSTNNLFTLYNSGELPESDKRVLLNWFEKTATETNDDEMMAVIANIFLNKEPASGNDYRAGYEWALKSAERGNPGGCFWLGFIYYKGLGDVPQSDSKAFSWILKAAQKGDKDAMKLVSSFYEFGTGTTRNPLKAAEWKAKAEVEE